MTVTVRQTTGPDPAFFYLLAECEYQACATTRSIPLARLADGTLTIAAEKAALVADVEQKKLNFDAALAAAQEL
jgi:hypothetical protein